MNPHNISSSIGSSPIFAEKSLSKQVYTPWYCYFCYVSAEQKDNMNSFSHTYQSQILNVQKTKLRHSLKRTQNFNNKDSIKTQKTKSNITNQRPEQISQSYNFNHYLNKENYKQGYFKQNYHNIESLEKPINKQKTSSQTFQRNSLPFFYSVNQNSIKPIKQTPQSQIYNYNLKNDFNSYEQISTTNSIKFTEPSTKNNQFMNKEICYNREKNNKSKFNNMQRQDKIRVLNTSTSIPILQKNQSTFEFEQLQNDSINKPKIKYFKSDISTKQDFQSKSVQKQMQLINSVQDLPLFNIFPPKKKVSIKSSSSINQSGDIKSSLSEIGLKNKIGIRKVQSIVSNEDSDQFSQVIYGQRNFLMPQIHQVEQLSRVSSRESLDLRKSEI